MNKQGYQSNGFYNKSFSDSNNIDQNQVQILYFNYKTYMNQVYKTKDTATGAAKVIAKDDDFIPAEMDAIDLDLVKLSRSIEVLFEGAMVLGTKKILKWGLASNMMRPKSDYTKVK